MLALVIVGGLASADPAVVPLVRDDVLVCTGTVVAPHAVLTAAHCLTDPRPLTVAGHLVIARIVVPTFDAATLAHDLAIAIVDPLAIAPLGHGSTIGGEIVLEGFGHAMVGDTTPFAQRAGTAALVGVEPLSLRSSGPAFTCEGDSGGPAIQQGVIVGVTSSGDCATISRHARVDIDATFIDDTLAKTAPGGADAGERCWYEGNCANGAACVAAVDEPRVAFCAPACTSACAGGLLCVDGLCRHPLPSPGAEGATCEAAQDCASHPCLAPRGDDDAICARRCFSDLPGFTCPGTTRCLPADDGGEACFAPAKSGGCSAAPQPTLWLLLAIAQLLRGRGKP